MIKLDKKKRVFTLLVILGVIIVGVLFSTHLKKMSPCDGQQWSSPQEYLDCRFPKPPIGRWHAVYSAEFAKSHNLPPENISNDLSPGVDYMEMDVQPYADGLTACIVNMLIKKPNDVAVYGGKSFAKNWEKEFHRRRQLSHLLDLDQHKDNLQEIATFGFTTRDNSFDESRSYSIGSSIAFYGGEALVGNDYISANASCYHMIAYPKAFPDGWAFNYAKASIWGRNEYRFKTGFDARRPEGKAFYDSRITINIPQELVLAIMKDMPMGGR